ncbi:MAG: hypothetical protein H0W61_14770, partial [Bacteroidetes bacterium]|nr:hypothetical protein [Bacteroidota bacterium]
AKLQAYLVDEQGLVIDSLLTPGANVIDRGLIDAQNVVYQSVRSQIHIPLTKEKIEHLKKSTKVKLVSYFIMPPNPPEIKIFENYSLDVNILAEVNYRVERK